MIVRDGKESDLTAFYGRGAPKSGKLRVAEENGEVVALIGYYPYEKGTVFVFSDIKPEATQKVALLRHAVRFLRSLDHVGVCIASDGAGPLLERLGWVYAGDDEERQVYAWPIH